jgi:hypothetical protein
MSVDSLEMVPKRTILRKEEYIKPKNIAMLVD